MSTIELSKAERVALSQRATSQAAELLPHQLLPATRRSGRNLFHAGHAHAGVLVILSLVMQLLANGLGSPTPLNLVARLGAPCAAILMPLGFFLSVTSPEAQKPNGLIALVYAGALLLALSAVLLGVLLLRAF